MKAEILFRNGTVFDGHRFLPAGTCVRVRGGRITGVGPAESLGSLGSAEPVDLDGGTLLPGFIDAHAHPVFAGHQLRHCDLSAASTEPEYLEIIARYAREHPYEEWITGGGWELPAFPAGIPARQSLDAVVPDRPVYLPNCDGHGAWVNSPALRLAGIDARTPDPPDGRIEREAGGEPAGMLQEGAMALVARLLPEVTDDDNYAALLAAQDCLLSLGITGWQDAIVGRMPGERLAGEQPRPGARRARGGQPEPARRRGRNRPGPVPARAGHRPGHGAGRLHLGQRPDERPGVGHRLGQGRPGRRLRHPRRRPSRD
jgi:predicted amidohydrolase YtcJ